MHIDVGEANRHMTEIELNELQVGERSWECRLENRLDGLLHDVGAGDTDVGPKLGYDVVEEACLELTH